MRKSKIDFDHLTEYFEANSNTVFSRSDLETLFVYHGRDWNVPPSMGGWTFFQMLLKKTLLREIRLQSKDYPSLLRYAWAPKPHPLSVALSIKKNTAFFSHNTAMWIHGVGNDENNIFINKEQSPKPRTSSPLSQEAIHRAFRNQQRRSNLIYKYRESKITLISGKNTGRTEVEVAKTPSGHKVEVTSLERTLVDATVRPGYSGGVQGVLQAYRLAKNRISVSKLLAVLNGLDYKYPYHQSIGFYLGLAGYTGAEQNLLKSINTEFEFYLSYGMKNPDFDPKWKVFFPRRLK